MTMSSNSTNITQSILQLQLASKYLNLTFALPLCISGLLGNLINILVFITLGNYKHNASSLYVLCKSFFDLTAVLVGLGLRVFSSSFAIDFTLKSQIWCKLRIPLVEIGIFNSFTCLCLQSIDAFFSSSSSVSWRQKSNVRTARYLLVAFFLFWIGHQVPYVILQDLVDVKGKLVCRTTNTLFAQYRSYFVTVALGNIIPVTMMSVFGFLTYRQLHTSEEINNHCSHRRRSLSLSHLVRQMTNMTLIQVIIVLLCQTPFVIVQVYAYATDGIVKDTLRQAQEQVVQMVAVTLSYGSYAVSSLKLLYKMQSNYYIRFFQSSFYSYCAASKRFRQQVSDMVKRFISNSKNRALPSETISHLAVQQSTIQI
jgi:hypothetical protein